MTEPTVVELFAAAVVELNKDRLRKDGTIGCPRLEVWRGDLVPVFDLGSAARISTVDVPWPWPMGILSMMRFLGAPAEIVPPPGTSPKAMERVVGLLLKALTLHPRDVASSFIIHTLRGMPDVRAVAHVEEAWLAQAAPGGRDAMPADLRDEPTSQEVLLVLVEAIGEAPISVSIPILRERPKDESSPVVGFGEERRLPALAGGRFMGLLAKALEEVPG